MSEKLNILIVGGTWNDKDGKPSGVVNKIHNTVEKYFCDKMPHLSGASGSFCGNYDTIETHLHNKTASCGVTSYNGGNYGKLQKILNMAPEFDIIFWLPNIVDVDKAPTRDVKSVAPFSMLVTSIRNDNEKYTFEDMIQNALAVKANLCFEFSKVTDKTFKMRVFDPLACLWYRGTDINDAVTSAMTRLEYLRSITRKPTKRDDNRDVNVEFNEADRRFLELVRKSAEKFHEIMGLPLNVKRFVGNAGVRFKNPTRCMKGFPAIKYGDIIMMSRRNVNKENISEQDFVPVFEINDNICYKGKNKPSIDTPVQIELFKHLPNIKYILHGHCYISDDAHCNKSDTKQQMPRMTAHAVPCGAVEEAQEILTAIDRYYPSRNGEFYAINLKGHGCLLMMSENTLGQAEDIHYSARPMPEAMIPFDNQN